MAEFSDRDRYYPDDDCTVSDAIIDAISEHEGSDLDKESFVLFDHIDPEALDHLFREEANANVCVQFDVYDVTVRLWGDGGVDVLVTGRDEDPEDGVSRTADRK